MPKDEPFLAPWPRDADAEANAAWLLGKTQMPTGLAHRLGRLWALAGYNPRSMDQHIYDITEHADHGWHFVLREMPQRAQAVSRAPGATYIFAAHATSASALHGILAEGCMRGSSTLGGVGFWAQAAPDAEQEEWQWEAALRAAGMGRNTCDVIVGMDCPGLEWVPLDAADHALETRIVETGKASHLRRDGRWAVPLAAATLGHLFVLRTALEQNMGFLKQ